MPDQGKERTRSIEKELVIWNNFYCHMDSSINLYSIISYKAVWEVILALRQTIDYV